MGYIQLFLISIGLAMDAFAVSICKGLSIKNIDRKMSIIVGLYFGLFQAIMPLIGFLFGGWFKYFVINISHWIVFSLLVIIGMNMIFETINPNKDNLNNKVDFKSMFLPALATSIDALAVGVTFAFLDVNLLLAISMIGIVAFILTVIGVYIGSSVGSKYENKAKILGGIILIIIGFKTLLEHLL